jgi:hypothetical protein
MPAKMLIGVLALLPVLAMIPWGSSPSARRNYLIFLLFFPR